ncbi:hypothetical protein N9043_00310 [bacterium]|nr:hypothetical protein [bacterium]
MKNLREKIINFIGWFLATSLTIGVVMWFIGFFAMIGVLPILFWIEVFSWLGGLF